MTEPLATIVIPTFNDFDHLRQSFEDAMAQTWPAIEVVVVDDGSAEPAEPHVRAWSKGDARVRVVRRTENGGVFAALNTGARHARGEFLYLGSSNDRIVPNFVARSGEALMSHPDVGLCFSDPGILLGWGDQRREFPLRLSAAPRVFSPDALTQAMRQAPFHISSNTLLFRTQVFLAAGGYRPELSLYADWFTTMAVAFSTGIAYVPEVLAYSRSHSDAYSSPSRWSARRRCEAAAAAVRTLLAEYPAACGNVRDSWVLSAFGYRCVRRLARDPVLGPMVGDTTARVALLRDAWRLARRVVPDAGQRFIRRLAS